MKKIATLIITMSLILSNTALLAKPSHTAPGHHQDKRDYNPPKDGDDFNNDPDFPSIYADGITSLKPVNLQLPEKGAYAGLEFLQTMAEVYVQERGCNPNTGDVTIDIDANGNGTIEAITAGPTTNINRLLKMYINKGTNAIADINKGSFWNIVSFGSSFADLNFGTTSSYFIYNPNNTIAQGNTNIFTQYNLSHYTTTIIKDFYLSSEKYSADNNRLHDVVLDWGLQQLAGYPGYPVAKYWQRSSSIKDEGVTHFTKLRLAGGNPCFIDIQTKGNNNSNEFYQTGEITINPVSGYLNPLK